MIRSVELRSQLLIRWFQVQDRNFHVRVAWCGDAADIRKAAALSAVPRSYKLQFSRGKPHHAKQEHSMAPAVNIRGAVCSLTITDRHIRDLHVLLRCAKQQI